MAPTLISKDGVRVFIRSNEHLPPHIHVVYGSDVAMIDIRTGKIIKGTLGGKQLNVVNEWLEQNRLKTEEMFYVLNPSLRPGYRNNSDKAK